MQFGRIIDVLVALVIVAGVTTAVSSSNTASIISATGTAFSNSLFASEGK